jgi:hypothetical protein
MIGPKLLAGALLVSCGACIIPDSDIDVLRERNNRGAVRIVQRVGMSPEANVACTRAGPFREECPLPPPSQPSGLVDFGAEGQAFCVCAPGDRDANVLRQFDIFVEDADLDQDDNSPVDAIFGAFLLDVPDGAEDPSEYLAYTNVLPPNEAATLFPIGRGSYNDSIDRPPPQLKSWTVGIERGFDLCNDDVGRRLQPGIHELRLVVTDRPWYVEVQTDAEGQPLYVDGVLQRAGTEPRFGVPDIPGGATYDIATFVFRCLEPTNEACGCTAVEEP